ncbi:MAG TPA: class IV adenylate cyclase [Phycisphaerae bacterium]|nr:class IV adenylate cyclase [Phycisphaerae bacterium]
MGLEIEAKLRVESHEPLRRKLAALGTDIVGRVRETNHILDSADGSLRSSGSALRVRANQPADGGSATATVTFKGPVQPGAVKRREEIEASVDDPVAMLELLRALGFVEVMTYRKRRESYRLDNCRIELDEVPMLGCFVEIEGPDERAIRRVQQRIGLADLEHIPKSYIALLSEHCHRTGRDPRDIDFDDG